MEIIEAPPKQSKTAKKRIRGDALQRLAKASARKVRDNSEEIIGALLGRVLAGDVSCAKLLVTLIERLPPRKKKFRSIATEWANSPEWEPPEDYEEDPYHKAHKLLNPHLFPKAEGPLV
jgi:hypothetical protein